MNEPLRIFRSLRPRHSGPDCFVNPYGICERLGVAVAERSPTWPESPDGDTVDWHLERRSYPHEAVALPLRSDALASDRNGNDPIEALEEVGDALALLRQAVNT
jgi:hypothetical protein